MMIVNTIKVVTFITSAGCLYAHILYPRSVKYVYFQLKSEGNMSAMHLFD